jgi:20S proteasome alpha/beta subunit
MNFFLFIIFRLNADARSLVEIARMESQNHRFVFNEGMKVKALT